ncbi:hypothetical protein J2128_001268 [Methanomicrobium sp. W14]|nr:hypothetical protein [Methanomicrobium sp. W14]
MNIKSSERDDTNGSCDTPGLFVVTLEKFLKRRY